MEEQTFYTEKLNLVNEFNLRTILDVLLTKWQWFALSVFLFMVVAYIYKMAVPVVYEREAVVQLKNKVKTEEAFSEKQMFDDSENVNIDGEILIFKSRLLMGQIIRKLGLEIGYSVDDGLKNRDLYMDMPIKISFPDSTFTRSAAFSIIPVTNDRFKMTGLEDDPDGVMEYTFETLVDTPLGRMMVNRTPFFNDEWLDIPVQIFCRDMIAYFLPIRAVEGGTLCWWSQFIDINLSGY